MGPDVMIFVFLMLSFKPAFSLSSSAQLSEGICWLLLNHTEKFKWV